MSAAMDEAPVIRQETGASGTPIREYRAIDSIVVADRHRSDLGDLSDLAASIKAIGMLNPVTITADGRLIAGQRRMEACRLLGVGNESGRPVDEIGLTPRVLEVLESAVPTPVIANVGDRILVVSARMLQRSSTSPR